MESELGQRSAPEKMSEQMIWFLSTYVPSEGNTDDYWKDVFSIFLDSVVVFNSGKVVITFNLFDDDPILKNRIKKELECFVSVGDSDFRDDNSGVYQHVFALTPLRICLSLLRYSDKALKQLIQKYEQSKEPTMILFFGDHQPNLSAEAGEIAYKAESSQLDYYCTPFFIWTNYDTEEEMDAVASANYLPCLLLERANLPLPPYLRMVKEVYEKYPVIEYAGVMDAQGTIFNSAEELSDDPLIQKYQQIQYANVTGTLDEAWFQVP